MNEYNNPKVSKENREQVSKTLRRLNQESQKSLKGIIKYALDSAKTLEEKKGVLHIFSFSKISEQTFSEAIKNDKLLLDYCLLLLEEEQKKIHQTKKSFWVNKSESLDYYNEI